MGRRRVRSGRAVREERRKKAEEMALARSALSPAQQLEQLDQRLGVGVGAQRERARLQPAIETPKPSTRKKTDRARDGDASTTRSTVSAKERRQADRARSRRGSRRSTSD